MASNLPFGSGVIGQYMSSQTHLAHVSTLSGRAIARIRPVIRKAAGGGAEPRPTVSCCLSAAGVRFLGHPVPAGELRLPHGRPTGPMFPTRTPTGFPRSTRARYDRGGCSLYPEAAVSFRMAVTSTIGACRFSAASPAPRCNDPSAGLGITRHHREFTHVHPSGLPLPVASGWNGNPWVTP